MPETLLPSEYECAECGGIFTKAWSDEEAQAEADALWTPEELAEEGEAVICQVCFDEFMAWQNAG